jgi:hypothetical protein
VAGILGPTATMSPVRKGHHESGQEHPPLTPPQRQGGNATAMGSSAWRGYRVREEVMTNTDWDEPAEEEKIAVESCFWGSRFGS